MLRGACGPKTDSRSLREDEFGVLVLVTHPQQLKKGFIWPEVQSIFHGPCGIAAATDTKYELVSRTEKSKRRPVHARRLVSYH